jgi:hypothetical protein
MPDDNYQANWRGARRYQFDEEARRKASALQTTADVVNFRRVKWADPDQKLKVLSEDLPQPYDRSAWLDRLPTRSFYVLVAALSAVVFLLVGVAVSWA